MIGPRSIPLLIFPTPPQTNLDQRASIPRSAHDNALRRNKPNFTVADQDQSPSLISHPFIEQAQEQLPRQNEPIQGRLPVPTSGLQMPWNLSRRTSGGPSWAYRPLPEYQVTYDVCDKTNPLTVTTLLFLRSSTDIPPSSYATITPASSPSSDSAPHGALRRTFIAWATRKPRSSPLPTPRSAQPRVHCSCLAPIRSNRLTKRTQDTPHQAER